MLPTRIRMIAARIVTSFGESRRKAHRHNHDYLEFWRAQHGA
jgi:hypothetical protein